jgi:predicted deacetylase
MKVKYIIRLDDASHYMNISKWDDFLHILDKYNVKPIIAVIPNNEDYQLMADNAYIENFWQIVSDWNKRSYVIAMHGYNHCYITSNAGIIGKNCFSEFAGVSYKKQSEKIILSKQIFEENSIDPKIFVAPAHSFDSKTIKVLLKHTNIRIISDGFAYNAFRWKGMNWIPQQLWRPEKKETGLWTICYHPQMATNIQLNELDEFLKEEYVNVINPLDITVYSELSSDDIFFLHTQKHRFKKNRQKKKIKIFKQKIKNLKCLSKRK